MTTARAQEVPVTFDCCGSDLYGIVHVPDEPTEYGLLTVVAGGPQYRAGCGRQLLTLARELADSNIPVMRFDQRGIGDSHGDFLGFENMEEDLRAAIEQFKATVPAVKRVILWGGCDGASSTLINAHKFPEVRGAIVANPFVSSEVTQQALNRKHYFKRLKDITFWKKVFSFQYDYLAYLKAGLNKLRPRKAVEKSKNSTTNSNNPSRDNRPFVDKMLEGLQGINGPVLFLMSGHSPTRKEFDEFLVKFPRWNDAYSRSANSRIDFPDADQTFSTRESRDNVNSAAKDWMLSLGR